MIHNIAKSAGFLAAMALAWTAVPFAPSVAQQAPGGEWFVPGQGGRPAAAPPPAPRPAPRPAPPPQAGTMSGAMAAPGDQGSDGQGVPPLQVQLPPAPELPPLAKGPATPAAIIGIISPGDVQRLSTAFQAAYKELSGRAQKLNEDVQKERTALDALGQAFKNDRAKLSPEEIRRKEREITDRVTEAERKFAERNRIIREAEQYVMLQINRTMDQAAQQIALSRGINIVLNRAQILGTTADFDLTPAVADLVNQVLPSVIVPPDGVSPLAMAQPAAAPQAVAAKPPAPPAAATPPAKK